MIYNHILEEMTTVNKLESLLSMEYMHYNK